MKHYIQIKTTNGFSILEIMIAITISLILMLGILQIFIANKTTYRLEDTLSIMQDNSRYLNDYLNKLLRNTAYRSATINTQFTAINNLFTGTNAYIAGSDNTGPHNSDSITIRFQGSGNGSGTPDDSILDCLNQGVDANIIATNTLSINNNDDLICQSINPSAAVSNNTQVILEDVENMQILYGEDLNQDKIPDRFVSASHPSLNFGNVVGVKISLLLKSPTEESPMADTSTYNLLGATYTPNTDNFIRQSLTFTIMLRNVVTEVVL